MALAIGDTVWVFDTNRRVYPKDDGGPIYREHFRPLKITGETRASWLLEEGLKIDKANGQLRKPSPSGWYGLSQRVYSASEVEDACFVEAHRYPLSRAVQRCEDAAALRTLHQILQPWIVP